MSPIHNQKVNADLGENVGRTPGDAARIATFGTNLGTWSNGRHLNMDILRYSHASNLPASQAPSVSSVQEGVRLL